VSEITVRLRRGNPDDAELVLGLLDEAVAWLVARGQPGQWGTEPFSENPARVAQVRGWAGGTGLWIAELAGSGVGVLVVGQAPAYAGPAEDNESYITLLLASRAHAGLGLGSKLVEHAVALAQAEGRDVLRVDCWAGAPSLVAWYERQGFERTTTFDLNGWRGQLFRMPVTTVR